MVKSGNRDNIASLPGRFRRLNNKKIIVVFLVLIWAMVPLATERSSLDPRPKDCGDDGFCIFTSL